MRKRTISGRVTERADPDWEPLVTLVGGHRAVWFMWMFEIELTDGSLIHSYKHSSTRRYLHLGEDGRAYVYVGDSRYREIEPELLVDLVFAGWDAEEDA